ncbi:hypothetical protein F8388_001656 [Cannabis sativa]|uniref:adenylate kinase n=1 Tax=Cannabis sativa TaxID=3483 RepID=A0A7J6HKV9_CANSA|nr:hypothetical protein F8388_001656 [Cannabis sativa]
MGAVVDAVNQDLNGSLAEKNPTVVFVLGGPGSGKGTQCANIVEHFGYTHLSAGDLLRAEIKSGSENGTMIQEMIREGKIVPSEVTIKLLQKAMQDSGNDKFLIDGFPRNEENRAAFEKVGREDDNVETIRKRFNVFLESSLPVIKHYEARGKVKKIDAARPVAEVFETVKGIFAPKNEKVKGFGHILSIEILLLGLSIIHWHQIKIEKSFYSLMPFVMRIKVYHRSVFCSDDAAVDCVY